MIFEQRVWAKRSWGGGGSQRTQTYFRLSLVSAESNVCEPEPGNDFCDVMTFVSPWPIRFHDGIKLECSSQWIPHAVVMGLLELNCDWLKIPTSQKSFPGSGSQTLFSAKTSDSRKYVCVRRLEGRGNAQKNSVGVYDPLPKTLILTKIYDIPYPIYDLTKDSKPCLWPDR